MRAEYLRSDRARHLPPKKAYTRKTTNALKDLVKRKDVEALVDAMTNGTASPGYKKAFEAAISGQGVVMARGLPAKFGRDGCLRDTPLNPRSLESVELWLTEVKKLVNKDTASQGALSAILGHFKLALG